MALNIKHLGDVREKLYEARTKWYDIGLALKIPVTTLDSIECQCGSDSKKLLEALKIWLKTATEPTWQDIVGVLKRPVVGEPKLASDIEAEHCTTAETQPNRALQQAIQDGRELQVTQQQDLLTQVQQLQDSKRQLQRNQLQHELANKQLQGTVGQLTLDLQQAMEEKQAGERKLQELNQQLLKMPQVRAQLHETITPPRPELQQPQTKQHATKHQQLRQMKRPGPLPQKTELQHATEDEQLPPMKQPRPLPQKTVMQQKAIPDMIWQKESKAPEKMHRGSAAADSNMAYFHGYSSMKVHSYDSNTREWRRLPAAPHIHFTLVVVQNILTMVGGEISSRATNSLLSLMSPEGRAIKKWLPNFPAMPTKRYYTAAMCSGYSLIVAGGSNGHNILSTVEVLDTDIHQWSTASSLTHPFSRATISICSDRLYMLGGFDDQTGYHTRSVLSCSVPELLQSSQPHPLAGKLQKSPANQSTIWRHVAAAPHYMSSCATLCGQLVAVGGEEAYEDTSAITVYNETTDCWEAMEDMPTARHHALVAILNGKMMVVGGWVRVRGTETDVVEILC